MATYPKTAKEAIANLFEQINQSQNAENRAMARRSNLDQIIDDMQAMIDEQAAEIIRLQDLLTECGALPPPDAEPIPEPEPTPTPTPGVNGAWLAMNLSFLNACTPFADVLKQSWWEATVNGATRRLAPAAQVKIPSTMHDPALFGITATQPWPTKIPTGAVLTLRIPRYVREGFYELDVDVDAVWSLASSADGGRVESGNRLWLAGGLPNQRYINFTALPSGMSRLSLRHNDDAPNAIFDPRLLANLAGFVGVRFLNFSMANHARFGSSSAGYASLVTAENCPTTPSTAANRSKPTDPLWGGGIPGRGADVPLEIMIALCNKMSELNGFPVDAALQIPFNAEESYVREMARLVRDTLVGEAKVEYSNENWNYQFGQAQELMRWGMEAGLDTGQYIAGRKMVARMHNKVFDWWKSETGLAKTKRVLGGQFWQAMAVYDMILGFENCRDNVDEFWLAPYASARASECPSIAKAGVTQGVLEAEVAAGIYEHSHGINATLSRAADWRSWAIGQGLTVGVYETAVVPDYDHYPSTSGVFKAAVDAYEKKPEFLDAMGDLLTGLKANFPSRINWFCLHRNRSGTWGIMESPDDGNSERLIELKVLAQT